LRHVYVTSNGQRVFIILSLISFAISTQSSQRKDANRTGLNPVRFALRIAPLAHLSSTG